MPQHYIPTSNSPKTLLVISGPTAVGKSAMAMQLAKQHDTCMISADSRQCYKELNIGTAKSSEEELASVKHYFINSQSIGGPSVSAADFERLALGWLEEEFQQKDTVILCGGTGLYIDALCYGLDEMPSIPEVITLALQKEFEANGLVWLQAEFTQAGLKMANESEANNPHRLLRALAFYRHTEQDISNFRNRTKKVRPFRIIKYALEKERELLYKTINSRVDKMMEDGLLEEVKSLQAYKAKPALQTVGYSELFDHLDGKYSLAEAVEKIKQHSRNYAKRQVSWLKRDGGYVCVAGIGDVGI